MTDEPSPPHPVATDNMEPAEMEPAEPHAARASGAGAPDRSDTLVQTALRLLPVPEHAPGFWEDLDAALAAEPRRQAPEPSLAVGPGRTAAGSVGSTAGVLTGPPRPQRLVASPTDPAPTAAARAGEPDPTRRLVPPSLRRRSNVVLLVLLVAAVALVLSCVALLVRSRADAGLGPRPAGTPAAGAAASQAG